MMVRMLTHASATSRSLFALMIMSIILCGMTGGLGEVFELGIGR